MLTLSDFTWVEMYLFARARGAIKRRCGTMLCGSRRWVHESVVGRIDYSVTVDAATGKLTATVRHYNKIGQHTATYYITRNPGHAGWQWDCTMTYHV